MNILLDGYFHTLWEAMTGHKLGHISTGDFWGTVCGVASILAIVEHFFGWKLGGKKFFHLLKLIITFPFRAIKWMEDVDQRWVALHAKVDNLSDNFSETKITIESNTKKIQQVAYQVLPNSGGSLNDKISRVDKVLARTETKVNEVFSKQFLIAAQIDIDIDLRDDAIFESDPEGNLIKANRKYLVMLGVPSFDHIKGLGWMDKIIPPENLSKVKENHLWYIDNPGEYMNEFEFMNYTTKEIMKLWVQTKLMHDEWGNLKKTIGYVTENK